MSDFQNQAGIAAKQPALFQALEQLEKECAGLSEAVAGLERRLEPLCVPSGTEKPVTGADIPQESAVVLKIRQAIGNIGATRDRVQTLLNRCQL